MNVSRRVSHLSAIITKMDGITCIPWWLKSKLPRLSLIFVITSWMSLLSMALVPPLGARCCPTVKREVSNTVYAPALLAFPRTSDVEIENEDDVSPAEATTVKNFGIDEIYNFWEEDITLQSFNMDLQNLAIDDPRKAKDALQIMDDMFRKGLPSTVQPDCRCYNTVIDGFIQIGDVSAAQSLLDKMERLFDEGKNANAAPSEYTYMMVAQAWADDFKADVSGRSASRAEAVMRRMQDRGLPPNVKVWSVVIEGWCKRAGLAQVAMERAEALLSMMEDSLEAENTAHPFVNGSEQLTLRAPPPNIVTYTSYIGGLARSKERYMARKADATLARMERAGVKPDVVAYTCVLNCWAKATNRREREMAASRAQRILDEMERRCSRGDNQAKPNLITYSTAIRAIGNSLESDAAQRAEGVLKRMYELYGRNDPPKSSGSAPGSASGVVFTRNPKPTTAIYNAVIHALSRAPLSAGKSRLQYVRKAEQYLAEMQKRSAEGEVDVEPNVHTWAAVLRSWAMSGAPEASENAQRVLENLERLHREGRTSVRPNYVCYTTVMGAWGKSRQPNALEKMESILLKMENHFTKTQEADMRPNTVSYVTVIDAFVRRNERNAAQRAQATVDRMIKLHSLGLGHVRPTRIVFNTLIHAWSKSKDSDSAQRAEEIFKWMEAQYQAGDYLVRPDEVSLCAVLNAWANQADPVGADRAMQIFSHMQSLTLEQRGFPISITMPNIVIKAIARSRDQYAVSKAEDLLIKLENDYIFGRSLLKPDVTTYSSVINCCAYYRHPEGKAVALEVALRTFRKLCDLEGEGPNNITFGTLFKAIANIMPPGDEREELVQSLFGKCCADGFVDAFVLSQIRNASPQLYRSLLEDVNVTGGMTNDNEMNVQILESIPVEWSGNVLD